MRILHLSHTPLVGAPGGICRALNQLEGIEARWAVLKHTDYGGLSFELDWRWQEDFEEILEFAETADVLHLHNYIDLDCKDFAPLNFSKLWDKLKPMVRHFHSTPQLIARYMHVDEQKITNCTIPKLVIAQYPERFFPSAKIVPNIVDVPAPRISTENSVLRLGYAPSNFRSARVSRWDTKGYPETTRALSHIVEKIRKSGFDIELDVITEVPHRECLARKSKCDVFIDDLVTGSYHLNTLEALMQGSATLCHVDERIQTTLFELLGVTDFPAIKLRLEDIEPMLFEFAREPNMARLLGDTSRQWMLKHWSPTQMANHFVEAYEYVLESPGRPFRPGVEPPEAMFRARTQHDLIWQSRHEKWPQLPPHWVTETKTLAGSFLRKAGLRK